MIISTQTTNGTRTLLLEAPEWFQFIPMDDGQTIEQCLTEQRDDLDQQIRRLQRQRARVTQALAQHQEEQNASESDIYYGCPEHADMGDAWFYADCPGAW